MPASWTNKLPTDFGYKCGRLHRQVTIKAYGWWPGHRTCTWLKGMLHRKCNNTNQTKFLSSRHSLQSTYETYHICTLLTMDLRREAECLSKILVTTEYTAYPDENSPTKCTPSLFYTQTWEILNYYTSCQVIYDFKAKFCTWLWILMYTCYVSSVLFLLQSFSYCKLWYWWARHI